VRPRRVQLPPQIEVGGTTMRLLVDQTRPIEVLMIHSPLVGPQTLVPLAAALRERRRRLEVRVPDLRGALASPRPQWRTIVDQAVSGSSGSTDVLIGHSGAGALLPVLAEQLGPTVVAFVDAIVPGVAHEHSASAAFVDFLDSLPHDGSLLPPWHTWWPDEVLRRVVPDDDLRRRIAADTPRVPRAFYDDRVALPAGWNKRHGCCYLQLSAAYDADRAQAEDYQWPTMHLDGQHLDVAVEPDKVAGALIDLIDSVRPT
jgi:hypothetical protein